jgi:hypothetical protein
MKTSFHVSAVLLLLVAVGAAAGEPFTRDLAPDVVEGPVRAAECVGSGDQTPACTQRALTAGQPGGILDGQRFTVLLVDGRILARTCAAGSGGRLRASGVLHQNGFEMSLARLEQDCGQGWFTVDVPHAGTLAEGAAGGDE